MKRANQLQPLSRQHHLGLHIARHAKECHDNPQEITEHWQALSSYMNDMKNHFEIEDNLLVNGLSAYKETNPQVASVLEKLKIQHLMLHEKLADIKATQNTKIDELTVGQVRQFANLLYEHIRFEERELLPAVEEYLTIHELDAIYEASPENVKHLEERR